MLGRTTHVVDALNHVTAYGHDAEGRILTATDANGHATTFSYWDTGRFKETIDPLGRGGTRLYDANGNRVDFADGDRGTTLGGKAVPKPYRREIPKSRQSKDVRRTTAGRVLDASRCPARSCEIPVNTA